MKVLTLENEPLELDTLPEEIDDIRYSVLDYSDPNDVDYIFVPLVFLESFNFVSFCIVLFSIFLFFSVFFFMSCSFSSILFCIETCPKNH